LPRNARAKAPDRSGADLLSDATLEAACEGKRDVGREGVVLFAEGEEESAMLKDIKRRAQVPERRHDEGDFAGDAPEFFKKRRGILDVLDRVRAEGVLELAGRKGKMVDIIDDDEVRHVGVFDDIDIDPATIGLSAADVEVPDGAPPPDDPAHDAVAEPVEGGKNEDEGGGERENSKEHGEEAKLVEGIRQVPESDVFVRE
jgi:hypothetical protein